MTDLLLRSFIICGAALLLAGLFRRSSASCRYLLLRLATVTLVALVPLYFLLPSIDLAVLPAQPDQPTVDVLSTVSTSPTFDWQKILLTLWLAGISVGLIRMAASLFSIYALVKQQNGGVLVSDKVAAPCTVGILRPVILLPSSARSWEGERLQMVLLHERTHIARGDWLWLVLSRVVAIAFWPNPLVHGLERATRLACEESCDDHVLAQGVDATSYSSMLMSLARELGGGGKLLAPGVLAASTLEKRLVTILSPHTRRRQPKGVVTVMLAVLTLGLVTLLASLRLAHAEPAAPGPILFATSKDPASGKQPLLVVDLPSLKPSRQDRKEPRKGPTVEPNRRAKPAQRTLAESQHVPLKSTGDPGPARAPSDSGGASGLVPTTSQNEPEPAKAAATASETNPSEGTNIVKDARALEPSDREKLDGYARGDQVPLIKQ